MLILFWVFLRHRHLYLTVDWSERGERWAVWHAVQVLQPEVHCVHGMHANHSTTSSQDMSILCHCDWLLCLQKHLAYFSWKDAWTSPESLNHWNCGRLHISPGLANPVASLVLQLYWKLFFCSWQVLLSRPNGVWRQGWWVLWCVARCNCLLVSNTFCRKIDLVQRARQSTACNSDQWGEGQQGQHCTAHPGLDSEHSWTPNWDRKQPARPLDASSMTGVIFWDDKAWQVGTGTCSRREVTASWTSAASEKSV